MTRATYGRFFAGIGTLSLRPFDLTEDVTTLHTITPSSASTTDGPRS